RHRPVSSEHKKRQEPKRHGNRGRNCHDPYFMKRNHRLPPPSLETVLPPSKGRESRSATGSEIRPAQTKSNRQAKRKRHGPRSHDPFCFSTVQETRHEIRPS